jgi:hypothetical protein
MKEVTDCVGESPLLGLPTQIEQRLFAFKILYVAHGFIRGKRNKKILNRLNGLYFFPITTHG